MDSIEGIVPDIESLRDIVKTWDRGMRAFAQKRIRMVVAKL